MKYTYDDLEKRYKKAQTECNMLRDMLHEVVDVLDLSDHAIEKHGPLGTPPAELVREVLEEKDRIISYLQAGLKRIQ